MSSHKSKFSLVKNKMEKSKLSDFVTQTGMTILYPIVRLLFFSTKKYCILHKNYLNEVVLMSMHNTCSWRNKERKKAGPSCSKQQICLLT